MCNPKTLSLQAKGRESARCIIVRILDARTSTSNSVDSGTIWNMCVFNSCVCSLEHILLARYQTHAHTMPMQLDDIPPTLARKVAVAR
jgi:hypothetical protein